MTIFWFRRDLRLEDNAGLFHALNADEKILPLFIFDSNILSELPVDDARVTFIHHLLDKINTRLNADGKSLAIFHGEPLQIFSELVKNHKIQSVYTNHDYEPYAIARDSDIKTLLFQNGIEFKTYKDHVIFEKSEITKDDGLPYVVFTPYSKKWKEKFSRIELENYTVADKIKNIALHSYPFLSLKDIGFTKSEIVVHDYDVSESLIRNYQQTRNYPSKNNTSKLSPHLRFGAVSIRDIVRLAFLDKNATFLNELIWREFFMQILWHYPHTVTKSFRPKYDGIKWRNDEAEFAKWCNGQTGYPIVDAGMRELNATGFMHNRVRMITAGFLCKHLLIDWRWGETYFAMKLLDYEQASNVGNWQWAAGSGVDAAPYFRIFNPTEQVKKFDKDLEYITKWVPEINEFSYPTPIVDHKEARERCLSVYKNALG